ncbi:MAG: radical SAM protein [Bacteroidales bacterium]
MNDLHKHYLSRKWILTQRGRKNSVNPLKPYNWLIEKECNSELTVEDVGVVFLTNRECPFTCLMCDLWKNTIDYTLQEGIIPEQIKFALSKMTGINSIKIYNSGSFFDTAAVPFHDYEKIASLLSDVKTIIVESHPAFIGERTLLFKKMLKPELQVAIGLEAADDNILERLNKKMTVNDFRNAVRFLNYNKIKSRAFILLKPPFLSEEQGIDLAVQTIKFAFDSGVECCTVIPVRTGNGAMERLEKEGLFSKPSIKSLEKVMECALSFNAGRVFADLWDLKIFSDCEKCYEKRLGRLTEMNLHQKILPAYFCPDCGY